MNPESLFATLGLSPEVMQALVSMKFENPTPVQEAVIPFLLKEEQDVTVLAKTGTGKTAAFGVPLVEKLAQGSAIQALVLCPTRELAAQGARALQSLGQFKGLHVTSILGGESYRKQLDSLRRKPQIVVSTPGRLVDLIEQKMLDLSEVRYLILDEADEMLSFGFQDSLETIRASLADNVHTWMFSATMSDSVKRLSQKTLKNPKIFSLVAGATALRIDSFAAVVYEEDKERALSLLLKKETDFYGIVFAQTKKQVAELEQKLNSMGIAAESLHGDKVQADRNRVLERMRRRQARVLVATDVAARGLDIEDLTHVVNFEIPWDVETYTHRIGRTARAGKSGVVWTLVRPKEAPALRKFERSLNFKFQNLKIPSSKDVMAAHGRQMLMGLMNQEEKVETQHFLSAVVDDFASENKLELNDEVKKWMHRYLQQIGVQNVSKEPEPRVFELRQDDGSRPPRRDDDRGGSGGGFRRGPPSRGGFRGNDRRDFGGGDRDFRGPPPGERREFRDDRGGNSGGFRPEGPRNDFRRDDRAPAPSFNNDRFGSNGPRPSASSGNGAPPARRPFRTNRDDRGGDRPAFSDRPPRKGAPRY